MTDNKENTRAWLYFAVFFAVAAFVFGYKLSSREQPTELIRTDTVTVIIRDTMFVEKPTEITRVVVRHDTVKATELVIISDTLENGEIKPVDVIFPIESITYKDSTEKAKYEAFVSGYRASLDSIYIECISTQTTITNTERIKPSRFGVGVQLGVGVSPKGVALPYLGIGVQYRLWPNK